MSKLVERDYREATQRLINSEQAMSFFRSYGISVETLRILMIGVDDEGNVIMPIFNTKNLILGTLTIFDIYKDGGIYKYDCYGLVGNPRSEKKSIVVAKNIIDVCLLWQIGIDNPVVVSDRDNTMMLTQYKEISFVDGDDDLTELLRCDKYSYDVKDLPAYLAMYRELPEKKLLMNNTDSIEVVALPMNIDGKIFIMTDTFAKLVDSDGVYYQTYKYDKDLRRFNYKGVDYYFKAGPIKIPTGFNFKEKPDLAATYKELFEYIYTNIAFISQDQANLIALYIIYAWGFYYKHQIKTLLHIIDPSYFQASIIQKVLTDLMPNVNESFYAPSLIVRNNLDRIGYNHAKIILDMCLSADNYDIGPKILVNDLSEEKRTLDIKRVPLNRGPKLRHQLMSIMFHYHETLEEDRDEGLYFYYLPFYQVGLKLGMTWRESKALFYNTCGTAQKVFKRLYGPAYVEKHATMFGPDSEDLPQPFVDTECIESSMAPQA